MPPCEWNGVLRPTPVAGSRRARLVAQALSMAASDRQSITQRETVLDELKPEIEDQ